MTTTVTITSTRDRYKTRIRGERHSLVADESPPAGDDLGPNPHELLLAALGATSMTLLTHARRSGWKRRRAKDTLADRRKLVSPYVYEQIVQSRGPQRAEIQP